MNRRDAQARIIIVINVKQSFPRRRRRDRIASVYTGFDATRYC